MQAGTSWVACLGDQPLEFAGGAVLSEPGQSHQLEVSMGQQLTLDFQT